MALIVLSGLFWSSAVMAMALAVAWAQFGRPPHARAWAIGFAVIALQALVNAVAIASGRPIGLMTIVFALFLVPGPIAAMSARQRAGLSGGWPRYAVAGGACALLLVLAIRAPMLRPFAFGAATLFSALSLVDYARIVAAKPTALEPAERMTVAAVVLLAVIQGLSAGLTCAFMLVPDQPIVASAYHFTLALALPPALVAVGAAQILLVASDLAVALRRAADHDSLTGLLNRRGFIDAATRSLFAAARCDLPVAVALADIDHFKAVNDRFGHGAGDRTLCYVADRLRAGIVPGDVAARIGGEEFALLLVGRGAATAFDEIERIRAAVAADVASDGAPEPVTVSFGIGEVEHGDANVATMLDAALDRADRALYLSKVGGRDRVTVAA